MLTRRAAVFGPLLLGVLSATGTLAQGIRSSAVAGRVVSLDLLLTEILISLGVRPLAVANIPLYRRLVAEPPVPEGTP